MEFRGVMGGFYRISEWIMRLSVINVLWIICGIPFFVAALPMFVPNATEGDIYFAFMLMGVLAPFTLFPSTAAMFSVARKWVTGDEDVPLFKTFFRGYKANYVQAMLGGLIYLLFAVVLIANFRFYGNQSGMFGILRFLVLSISVLLVISLFHFFSILTHLHMKIWQIVKNAVLITIGSPIRSLSMIVVNGIIFYVSFFMFTFLIPFFMGSLMAVTSFWHFHQVFGKLQDKQQALLAKDQEGEARDELDEQEAALAAEQPKRDDLSDYASPDKSDKA
ncbi:Uncharacterized membrane protein YesL [Paenibacillus sp. UNCCL117]|uniref:YesL family protein n=1 Tax=unclassified Paenibacillus TaxID=185978 RepID=UPI000891AB04|nr:MULTISPECIES: DUF624 domain-containing protein [unclassified Paenibacillus]SDC22316.1 Uncharacterized membrane protein YesL [Paenibacillus sp. cl123]SFW19003.1 Uncharacterized membrane protein YesL [Paenibacillus sp. UNCCL117]